MTHLTIGNFYSETSDQNKQTYIISKALILSDLATLKAKAIAKAITYIFYPLELELET